MFAKNRAKKDGTFIILPMNALETKASAILRPYVLHAMSGSTNFTMTL